MTDLNDQTKRLELVHRYLNAETTLDEEQLLQDYYIHTTEVLSPEEEDMKIIIISAGQNAVDVKLSDEKEAEFDRLMQENIGRVHTRTKSSMIIWSALLAAVVIFAFLIITQKSDETPLARHYTNSVKTSQLLPYEEKNEDMSLQDEDESICQNPAEEIGPASQASVAISDVVEKDALNTVVKDDEKSEIPMPETSQTDKPVRIVLKTTVDEPEEDRSPRNVSIANYSERKRNDFEYFPSGNASYVTHSISNANSALFISLICYMELHDDSIIYKVDGEWVSRETVLQLPPECIHEMQILKRGTAAAIKEEPAGQTNDIILITTKKTKNHDQNHSSVPIRYCPLMLENGEYFMYARILGNC